MAVAESMAFNMSMRTSQHKRKQPSTANPAYWGFYILLRVCPPLICSHSRRVVVEANPKEATLGNSCRGHVGSP